MAWSRFPYPDDSFNYSPVSLKKAWKGLHAGDVEPWPKEEPLIEAWIAFHSGQFEQATKLGLAQGTSGYAVANKATCIYANYLEKSREKKLAMFETAIARCQEQQEAYPRNPSGFCMPMRWAAMRKAFR